MIEIEEENTYHFVPSGRFDQFVGKSLDHRKRSVFQMIAPAR